MTLDLPTVLLQWAAGGLLFTWVTTRRREVGLGYGWLTRGVFAGLGLLALVTGRVYSPEGWGAVVRDLAACGLVIVALAGLWRSFANRREGIPASRHHLDLAAALIGFGGLVGGAELAAAGTGAEVSYALALARLIVGAAFLGVISDAMLLGHWYLVQPGLPRAPLLELNRLVAVVWPAEVGLLLARPGMVEVLTGTIDDGWDGMLGWVWLTSAVTTIALVGVVRLALREREYSAVMAATGLLYLAIVTGFGTDLVARAVLAP